MNPVEYACNVLQRDRWLNDGFKTIDNGFITHNKKTYSFLIEKFYHQSFSILFRLLILKLIEVIKNWTLLPENSTEHRFYIIYFSFAT
jgi:hypothetical protein